MGYGQSKPYYEPEAEGQERIYSGGGRTCGLAEFLENEICTDLIRKYENKEIRSVNELHERLPPNVKIGLTTLKKYLKEIKQATSQIDFPNKFEKGQNMRIEMGISKFDNKTILLIGTENEDDWRIFRRDHDYQDIEGTYNEYFACAGCKVRVIMRNGNIENIKYIQHRPNCVGEAYGKLKANNIDREMRSEAKCAGVHNPKTFWREGYEKCLEIDASNNICEKDKRSVSRNYPGWTEVRPSYGKRRQQAIGDLTDPYNLPDYLKVTNAGFFRIKMGKEVTEKERWLLNSSKEEGIILFATELQLYAANMCSILACDATFDVAPKGFYQLYTIHGLFSRESSTETGEWIVLAWALMEKRRTENYIHVLQILRKEWEKRGQLKIQRIHCDYEQAENNAVKAVFGEKFVFGCLFHFVKAALLHMRKEMPNMFRLYIHEKRIKGEFWKWVRRIIALPLLRRNISFIIWKEFKKCPMELTSVEMNECQKFCEYMEREWFRKDHNLFNFNNVGRVRGINAAEAYHSALKKDPQCIIHAKPVNFIRWQQTLAGEMDARILKLMENDVRYKSRSKKYENVDKRIGEIMEDYENWFDANMGDKGSKKMPYKEFLYGTQYALSLLSYQLMEVNEVGIPMKQAKKKLKKMKNKDNGQEFDHDYLGKIIKVEDLLNSPEKKKFRKTDSPTKKTDVMPPSGIDHLPNKKNWGSIVIGMNENACWSFLWKAVQLSKGRLEMADYLRYAPKNVPDGELENIFDSCVEIGMKFIVVFCEDNRYKNKVIECANKNRKRLFYQAYAYITPEEVRLERELLDILINIVDGDIEIESSEESDVEDEEDDDDYLEILGDKRPIKNMVFNPPDKNCVMEICAKWNYTLGNCFYPALNKGFNSTATPNSTTFIKPDGTQENHVKIRQDIQKFLLDEKRLLENGRNECDWWTAYYSPIELETRVKDKMEAANDASEKHKWASNFDFIAASLLFNLNFVHCRLKGEKERLNDGFDYNWEIYCPSKKLDKRMRATQDLNRPTCFIEFCGGCHFEVIKDVKMNEEDIK